MNHREKAEKYLALAEDAFDNGNLVWFEGYAALATLHAQLMVLDSPSQVVPEGL
jgi:hypothetical protein